MELLLPLAFLCAWQDAVGTSVGKWLGIGAVMSGALVTILQALAMYLAWRFAHMLIDVYAWFANIERGPPLQSTPRER